MPDSQAFARRTIFNIAACCGGIPFSVVHNIPLRDLIWEVVLTQRPMTVLVNNDNSGSSGGDDTDGDAGDHGRPSSAMMSTTVRGRTAALLGDFVGLGMC